MGANAALIAAVTTIARANGCTPAQISSAWLLAQGSEVVPLVGTKTVTRLAENAAAAAISLSAEELATLSALPRLQARACSAARVVLTVFCSHFCPIHALTWPPKRKFFSGPALPPGPSCCVIQRSNALA